MWSWVVFATALAVLSAPARSAGAGAARLVCYAAKGANYQECSHLVYTGDARGEKLDAQLKEWRNNNPRIKIVLRVSEADKDLRSLLKSKYIQGLEIYNAHKALNRTKVTEAVEAARAAVSALGGGPVFLALPAHPELLAKYYDLRTLVKKVDLMMVQTHALGAVKKMTYHPSRLSGLWDMMNTDSVVDLTVGLGVPASKIVISLPASVRQFTLVNETLSTPGSPAVDDEPKEVDQAELCRQLQKGRWTLERDQDLSAPYAFKDKTWMSFEDSSSVDVKGKYARVRGLAGLALHDAERDVETPCGPTLKTSLAKVLNQQSRAPRAAVLRSLEHEILSAPAHARALDALQVSPYRITQVVDSDGVIHSIREDTRTEFSCSRQGYFVHPRSCARFYRCVKFDQLSPEFTVFEFDCPAGLAFDARYEVCVWPGSLPHSQACPGSSEIAPVPQTRFICPEHEGYYADPENCRWFFACLDHGKAPLTAYEFRCPFGLGFDAEKLKCDWPWVVPACGNIARYEAEAFGFSGAALTGATGFEGQTADAVNVAAHNSLVSGASYDNLVGIQSGFLSKDDALDPNFIASQDFVNGQEFNHGVQGSSDLAFQLGQATSLNGNLGLVQATQYSDVPKYTSGSLILDEYRLPTKHHHIIGGVASQIGENGFTSSSIYSGSTRHNADNSGAYVHDPTGDHAVPYKHIGSPVVPYVHDASKYKDNFDIGRYSDSQSINNGQYRPDNPGAYFGTGAGGYTGSYNDYSGSYIQDDSGKYVAGVYRADGHIGNEGKTTSGSYYHQNNGVYSSGNTGYVTDSQAYTGASHTLTAGAVNVGLVGKTTLVDAGYSNQGGYTGTTQSFSHGHEISHNGHVPIISQPAVSIKHIGTDDNNFDGYIYHTTPTSSVVPTTATPLTPTTAVYSTYVPEAPRTSIKEIFGITQPRLTNIQHALVTVKQPSVQITDYNVGVGSFGQNSQSLGYDYPKPSINFEDGATYTTQAPIVVSTFKPDGFSHHHQLQSGYQYSTPVPVAEEPFKKVVAYTTGPSIASVAPTVSTYQPHSFSHETIHKVENTYSSSFGDGYGSTVSFEQPKTVVQYTTPQPSFVQSQGIVHNVDVSQVKLSGDSGSGYAYEKPALGYVYSKPAIKFEEVPQSVVYSTPAPVVSTYQPQSYSHETFHNVQTKEYLPPVTYPQQTVTVYENPLLKIAEKVTPVTYVQPTVQTYSQSTAQSHGFSHETLHKVDANKLNTYSENIGSGYQYEQPTIKFEETPKTVVEYTTATPVVSTYAPHSFSHQTLHQVEASKVHTYSGNDAGYKYEKPVIKFEETPKFIEYSTPAAPTESAYSHQTLHQFDSKVNAYPVVSNVGYKLEQVPQVVQYSTPAPIVSYNPQSYSHETVHKLENKVNTYSQGSSTGYTYEQPAVKIEEVPQIVQYTTPAPVVSTYQPHSYSHQTLHKVEASKVNAYSQDTESGYKYEQPSIKFEEAPKILQYTTPAPVVSTYNPQSYNHETIHNIQSISSTPKTIIEYKQPAVTVYENPILKFTQTVTPTPAIYTQQHKVSHVITQPIQQLSYQQSLGQGYSYNQPEIQRDAETINAGKTYSDATLVSQQYYHQSNVNHGIQDSGKKAVFVSSTPATLAYEEHYSEYESPQIKTYKAPEYVPPKLEYQQTVSTFAPVTQQEYNYKTDFRSQQYDSVPIQQVSFSTSHIEQPTKVDSVHFSSLPEIQSEYTAEEYLPPVVSTVAPVVSSTYRPVIYSTASTKEYLPPTSKPEYNAPEYLAPVPEYQSKEYLPPKVAYLPPLSTAKPTTQAPIYLPPSTKAPEYLPPKQEQNILNFESFGFKNADDNIQINPYKEYIVSSTAVPDRQHNIVVETSKSNLLGFGTVGPDAGLVSPVSYTTSAPVISSTYSPYYEISSQAPIRKIKPIYKSTTQTPYVESTSYRAPEYLPPLNEYDTNYNFDSFGLKTGDNNYRDEVVVSTSVPLQRKQNIVVQTAKSRLHSNDAGLTYTTSAPIISTEGYLPPRIVSSTYAPIKQELVEVTRVPARRTKPKVAVVTKVNDFNPLLVRKLGAVCSCQSPVLVLKGRRPNVQQDFDDYGNDYEEEGRGDISDVDEGQWAQKTARIQPSAKSAYVTSTFNPIIVPDDSFYQDLPNDEYESSLDITPKTQQVYSEQYASSTPTAVVTERTVRIKPRVKSVTVAPTYQTVLLKQETSPDVVAKAAEGSSIQSQSFDRYGPGGWRSREETLQGSIDCQRAGLFRHPKQCNKFYACRWDCTKQRFTLHVFNCPVQLSFDPSIGACNWPSQGPACQGDTLLTNAV